MSKSGRYGGTFAHADIAFEFDMWIRAEFKVYLIHEYKRLKQEDNNRQQLDWNFQRTLAAAHAPFTAGYRFHPGASIVAGVWLCRLGR